MQTQNQPTRKRKTCANCAKKVYKSDMHTINMHNPLLPKAKFKVIYICKTCFQKSLQSLAKQN